MPNLSSLIIEREIASIHTVEKAIARQVLHGGDIITNLLEVASLSEEALLWLLAESSGMSAGPSGRLEPSNDALGCVPAQLAIRLQVFPLHLKDNLLTLVLSEPLTPKVEDDLVYALDQNVQFQVVLPVRIRQAFADFYGVPLEKRYLRLLSKIEHGLDPFPSSLPPDGSSLRPLPRSTSLPAPTFGDAEMAGAGTIRDGISSIAPPSSSARPAIDLTHAKDKLIQDFENCETAERLFQRFSDFLSDHFSFVVLFRVTVDKLVLQPSLNYPAWSVALDKAGIVSEAISLLSPVVRMTDDLRDGILLKQLKRQEKTRAIAVPIKLRNRAVAVVYMDALSGDVSIAWLEFLNEIADSVGSMLERMILRRKEISREVRVIPPPKLTPPVGTLVKQVSSPVSPQRHRIEWLIDALTHGLASVRRAAGRELKELTHRDFGFAEELAPAERQRIQHAFRTWWNDEGRKQFVAHNG